MASQLSEEQKLKIEENRQRALALRAARQQQQQQPLRPVDDSTNRSLVNNCPSVASARALGISPASASSGTTHVRDSLSKAYQRTTAEYSSKKLSFVSSSCKPCETTTLTDSSNRVPAATVSKLALGAPVSVKCCLICRQKFAADTCYSTPLVEIFKSIPSKQYGNWA